MSVADAARILQLAPGSTDLKSAQAITLADIAVGDRVLVTGKAGDDAGSLMASRVILMKSTDIAQKNAGGEGGLAETRIGWACERGRCRLGTLTISAGAKKIQVQTAARRSFVVMPVTR